MKPWKDFAGDLVVKFSEPDLDRGIIPCLSGHRPSQSEAVKIYNAAERFADEAERFGIAVVAEEWVIDGEDYGP